MQDLLHFLIPTQGLASEVESLFAVPTDNEATAVVWQRRKSGLKAEVLTLYEGRAATAEIECGRRSPTSNTNYTRMTMEPHLKLVAIACYYRSCNLLRARICPILYFC